MKLTINKEFLVRHLFAFAVFASLGGWFGYDGFVRYPAADARALYASIEKSDPPPGTDLDGFKKGKVATQRIFALVATLAAAGVGLHLLAVARFSLEWDDEGFVHGGTRRAWADVKSVDESKWGGKGILRISGDGWNLALDGWHHAGVKDFFKKVSGRG